jgi:murein DD-endopeptidase MepM/ murein hydrolase activator NlpD
VDFADFLPNTQIAIAGLPIPAALPGTVALVIYDRFPWGNALIIETHLENPPPPFALPTPFPQIPLHTNLTCPGVTDFGWDASRRSLYLLYAHMQSAPALQPGEAVACGQELGAIGDTGNALNPHLHLEARLGPAGARFGGMAHYTGSATPAEQDAYCAWRVSGWFQLVNPLTLFGEGE